MEDTNKGPVERFLERTDLGEFEINVAARIVNGRNQIDEASAQLQKLREEGLRLEQRLVGLSHQVKAMADLAVELQSKHESGGAAGSTDSVSTGGIGVG